MTNLRKLFGWVVSVHEAVYKEEEPPVAIYPNTQALIQAQAYAAQHQLAVTQQQAAVKQATMTTNAQQPSMGNLQNAGYTPYYTVTGTGSGIGTPVHYTGIGTPVQSTSGFPQPTGLMVHIGFTDGQGIVQAITVDQAYVYYLQQISQMHAARYGYAIYQGQAPAPIASPPPTHKMVDGDFSFDEMEEAEHIIQELAQNHEKASSRETHRAA